MNALLINSKQRHPSPFMKLAVRRSFEVSNDEDDDDDYDDEDCANVADHTHPIH